MLTPLPAHLDQLIRAELWPDEELIWWGQPQARRSLIASIVAALIGGLILAPVLPFFLFNLFAVVMNFLQLFTGAPLGEVLANGIPAFLFLLIPPALHGRRALPDLPALVELSEHQADGLRPDEPAGDHPCL